MAIFINIFETQDAENTPCCESAHADLADAYSEYDDWNYGCAWRGCRYLKTVSVDGDDAGVLYLDTAAFAGPSQDDIQNEALSDFRRYAGAR